ncbi:MAG: hypothetical protein EX267_05215 [Acidimicrobiia bacterium]|nr:MAG: hypothetical protein EX267_05215 [Acidimicrobiia bacterium]
MFWFGRPPYLRWVAAATLVVGAAMIEFWPTDEAAYPFTSTAVEAGEPVRVEWRMLPAGTYPRVSLDGKVAGHAMPAGEPIAASDLQVPIDIPDGWWALALEAPFPLYPGAATRLVLGEGGDVPGIVIASGDGNSFGTPTALIAVPGEHASAVAMAASARQIVVLVAP